MYNYMNAAYIAKLTYEISLSPVHHSKISPSKNFHYAHALTCPKPSRAVRGAFTALA